MSEPATPIDLAAIKARADADGISLLRSEGKMKLKTVMRYDPKQRKLRLFRLIWQRGVVGDGKGYSAKLSVSIAAKLFGWADDFSGWRVTFCGVQLHHLKAYGGVIV